MIGRHGVEQRVHLRHLPAHVFQQLLQVLRRVLPEHAPVLVHELLEVGLPARFQHVVQVPQHLAHGGHVAGSHVLQVLAHVLHHVIGHLAAKLVHQLLELARRLRVHELVVVELPDRAAQALRQRVERLLVPLHLPPQVLEKLVLHRVLPRLPDALLRLLNAPVHALPLRLEDVLQLLLQVLHGVFHVEALELLLALAAEAVHEVAQPVEPLAVGHLHAPPHHVPQRAVDVAVLHQVLGERLHEVVLVRVEDLLRAVPLRVSEREHRAPFRRPLVVATASYGRGAVEVWPSLARSKRGVNAGTLRSP